MKVNGKQLKGYYHAKKKWISANDNYNKVTFGITQKEYGIIRQAEQSLFGVMAGSETMKLSELNNRIMDLQL